MVLFGAGADFKKLVVISGLLPFVEVVVDSDSNKVGKDVFGVPVKGLEFLQDMRQGEVIYITSSKYYEEISAVIHKENSTLKVGYLGDIFPKKNKPENKILYSRARNEREVYEQYKHEYLVRDERFKERYFNLVRYLDKDSVDAINMILHRLQILYSSDSNEIDLFDSEEQAELRTIREKLTNHIVQICDGVYAYKNYYLPLRYFDNGIYYYYYYGLMRLKDLEYALSGDIIDCGAFIGDSSLLFSRKTKGKVYAIEAQGKNVELIYETIRLNHVQNIEVIKKGVGEKKETGFIYQHENGNFGTLNPYDSRQYIEREAIEIDTIDHIVEENHINVSLIKADIEGSESAMLRGAVNTLRRFKPTLMICIHHTPTDFWGIKPFLEKLNLGYTFRIIKKVDGNILTGTILIAEVDRNIE
jgi:FkbM family methyltransferase